MEESSLERSRELFAKGKKTLRPRREARPRKANCFQQIGKLTDGTGVALKKVTAALMPVNCRKAGRSDQREITISRQSSSWATHPRHVLQAHPAAWESTLGSSARSMR